MIWGTPVEIETRRRIRLAVWSYAYEFENVSLVSDGTFDVESYLVNLKQPTNRPGLDFWFQIHFQPATGLWVHHHPELDKIKNVYNRFYKP